MNNEIIVKHVQRPKENKKRKGVVSFDKEIVTKGNAAKFISTVEDTHEKKNGKGNKHSEKQKDLKPHKGNKLEYIENVKIHVENDISETLLQKIKRKKKMKEIKAEVDYGKSNEDSYEEEQISSTEIKANKKRKKIAQLETKEKPEANNEVNVENSNVQKGESIRAQKRKKHAKLMEDKRLKTEIVFQQNVLNYLSKWKHSRDEWKFEKLKQIWLQQNLFDTGKIPEEFWETIVEYFSGSKGFIRNVVIRDALKIIEKEENAQEANTDADYLTVLKRARDIVQSLQE